MALKIRLNPSERILIGGAVIRNGSTPAVLLLENTVPVLREKDILTPDQAQTPCQRLYLAVQLMYIDPDSMKKYHEAYWSLTREIVEAAPSTLGHLDAISSLILRGGYYQALKATQRLIRYEKELTNQCQ